MNKERRELLIYLMQAGFEYAEDRRINLKVFEGYPHMASEIEQTDKDMDLFLSELERLKNEETEQTSKEADAESEKT